MLGILMLDTVFDRPLGDVGHPETFERLGIEARQQQVLGASPQRVVREADPTLLQPFIDAALRLQAEGARMITTSCGFLCLFQQALQAAVRVPVLSSSLLWLAPLQAAGQRCGVLTIDATALDQRYLAAVGARPSTPVQGVAPGSEFQRHILGNQPGMDVGQACADVVQAARQLVQRHPELDTLVLECTNMPPYADAVRAATGRRVEHLVSLIQSQWTSNP